MAVEMVMETTVLEAMRTEMMLLVVLATMTMRRGTRFHCT